MTFHSYHHTEAFYQVVRDVKKWNKSDLTPEDRKVGKVKYRGTVKLHGMNAGVHFKEDNIIPQSRSNVLTIQKDVAGFAAFCVSNRMTLIEIEDLVKTQYPQTADKEIVVFGEWCGPGIQKGMAINALPAKQWVVFSVKVIDGENAYYLDPPKFDDRFADKNIFSILDCQTWELETDFHDEESMKKAIQFAEELTAEVEKCCPWGKKFGIDGLGEGIVWSVVSEVSGYRKSDLMFKTKGEKHKVVKEKEKAKIEPEKLDSINEFADFSVTENRLNQGIDVMRENGHALGPESTGHYLKWISQDIVRECGLELVHNGLIWKDVVGEVTSRARKFYLSYVSRIENQ